METPISQIDKRLIAHRFGKAATTYDSEAAVQLRIAEEMIRLLLHLLPAHPHRIVEFGCGTGLYTRLLLERLQPEEALLNDLCPCMESCLAELLSHKRVFRPGDAENMDFPDATDLITSCSTLQWFERPEAFFGRCAKSLRDGGLLAFSTFGPENMHEIHALTGQGLTYRTISELTGMLQGRFRILHAQESRMIEQFPTPMQVLYHLRRTGVTGNANRPWSRGRLREFCNEYETRFMQHGTVPLTYHPIYIVAQKK